MSVYLLILITTLSTIAGQLVLKRAVTGLKPVLQTGGPLEFLLGAATSPLVIAALSLQVLGYVAWMFVLSKEKLSVAFALSGSSFYLLMALASWYFFDERLSATQWLGLLLISTGVILVTTGHRTPGLG
ncbi:MAG: EamA family transporter [Pseudomonadota bacterium]|nr:EamA family transporter [Pseudomonadota bacterium]